MPSAYDAAVLAETSLTNYYPLNESSGTVANDIKGGQNGTCTGVTFGQVGDVADGSTAALFSGTGSGINLGAPFALGAGGVFTVEFLFKFAAATNFQAFYQNGTDASGNASWLNSATLALSINGNSDYTSGSFASLGVWHHVVCLYNGSRRQMYVDGVLALDSAIVPGTAPLTNNFIGRWANTADGPSFNGTMQKVAYYNSALSPARISAHFAAITTPNPTSPVAADLDIRMYGSDGKRQLLPSDWVESIEWEINERGGYGQGTLKVKEVYAGGFQTIEVERIDVRMWGQLLYRGFVRISQSDTSGADQTDSPTLYGMIEKLNGYLVRRKYAFVSPVSPDVLFTAMVNDFVKRSDRQPNIIIDVGGVSGLGLVIQSFDVTGKTFSQAMNDLCDLFPAKLIWGIDVDGSGTDRIYLRPRVTTTKYKFSIGDNVEMLTYPRDATQVVNTLLITGATLNGSGYPVNLCPNGSFESAVAPGEATSNLLLNPGFDLDNGGTRPGGGWSTMGDPSVDGTYGRSSPNAAVLDNNPTAEAIYQDCAVSAGLPCHASAWALVIAGETWRFRFVLTYYNSAGGVLDTITGPYITPPADNVYRHYQLDWPSPNATGAATLRYRLELDPANSGAHGLDIDDCSLWVNQVSTASWQPGINSGANFTTLDWANSDASVKPYDGGTMVKLQANISGGAGSYAQIMTTAAARIRVKPHISYIVSCWIWAANGTSVSAAIGAKVWGGATLQATLVGATNTWTSVGAWQFVSYTVTTGASSDGMDVLIRVLNGALVYIDAVSVFENNLPDVSHQEIYYPGSTYTAQRSVTDYSGSLSTDAAASITKFGAREASVSNANIFTLADLDAFCILYFNAHAVSLVNAGLTIFGPIAPVFLDGMVEIVNLATAPPPLFASNVRYRIDGQRFEMTIDLNNKQPDLALLLREIQEGTR